MTLFEELILELVRRTGSVSVALTEHFGQKHIHKGQWVFYDDFGGVEIRSRVGGFRTRCETAEDLKRILSCLDLKEG